MVFWGGTDKGDAEDAHSCEGLYTMALLRFTRPIYMATAPACSANVALLLSLVVSVPMSYKAGLNTFRGAVTRFSDWFESV